jgi:uncharacterized protein YrrD
MLIDDKKFKKVRVETKSGQQLGRLAGFEVDTDTGVMEKYYVKSIIPLADIFEGKLIVNKNQIVSFDGKIMVVEDNVLLAKAEKDDVLDVAKGLENPEPIISSKNV